MAGPLCDVVRHGKVTGHRVGDALTIARQMTDEDERNVQIEDQTGQLWGVEGLAVDLVPRYHAISRQP